jgi:hypothetical protein
MITAQVRVLDVTRDDLNEPPDAWEIPGTEADLRDFTRRRLSAYARRPDSFDDLPEGALSELRDAAGALGLEDMVLVPRSPRMTGPGPNAWALTPTSVLAVGDAAVALWVEAPGRPGIVARIALGDVAACIDRTILLYGRLEIAGPDGSIVLRYNTVGRDQVRALLLGVRRSYWPPAPPPLPGIGANPEALPYKWRVLLGSTDTWPRGPEPRVVAAGDLVSSKAAVRRGVAVLGSTELLVATEPVARQGQAAYGVDLVAVPRSRLLALDGAPSGLRLSVGAVSVREEVRVPAHPSLVAATLATFGPSSAAELHRGPPVPRRTTSHRAPPRQPARRLSGA